MAGTHSGTVVCRRRWGESATASILPEPVVEHPALVAHVETAEDTVLSALMSPEHVVAEVIAEVLTDEQSDVIEPTEDAIDDDKAAHEGSNVEPMPLYELSVVT